MDECGRRSLCWKLATAKEDSDVGLITSTQRYERREGTRRGTDSDDNQFFTDLPYLLRYAGLM